MKTIIIIGCLVLAGCAVQNHSMFVPPACIKTMKFTRPCAPISASLMKCDGVLYEIICTSVKDTGSAKMNLEVYK